MEVDGNSPPGFRHARDFLRENRSYTEKNKETEGIS